jgi:hypothetical protein
MMGNVIFATTPQANGNSGAGNYTKSTSSSGTSDAYTVRVSNALTVTSDTFAGFTGTGLVVANNVNQTQTDATTGGTTNYNGWGLGVNYEWQKLLLTANYQALKSFQSAATLTSPAPAMWTTASGGTNTQDNQTYIAGTYDFGILKAYAQYINRKVTDTLNTGYYAQRKAEQIGVRGFFATRIEGWASVGLGQATTFGAGGLSGQPLLEKSNQVLSYLNYGIGNRLPIIASGGIFNGNDAKAKMNAGASLIQIWTGFIYEGPGMVKNICNYLSANK